LCTLQYIRQVAERYICQESRHHDDIDTQIKIEYSVNESQTIHWWTWKQ